MIRAVRAHAFVSGRVQGVFFRAATQRRARELGLVGWVRNTGDGRVEVLLEGEEGAVREALVFLRQGPPHARVDDVEVRCAEATGGFEGFHVRFG